MISLIGALALALALVRTAAFSQTILVETRYLVPCFAWLDVATVLLAYAAYSNRRRLNVKRKNGVGG